MRQWIGQLKDEPRLWFMAWAPTKRAARDMISNDMGEVVPESIIEVSGPGYFVFRATTKRSERVNLAELEPPEGEYLILYDPRAEEWILRRAQESAVVAAKPKKAKPAKRPRCASRSPQMEPKAARGSARRKAVELQE